MHSATISFFDDIRYYLFSHLVYQGIGNTVLVEIILLATITLVAVAGYYLTKLLLHLLDKIIIRTPTQWDNDLLNQRMMSAISQLTPALIVNWLMPDVFKGLFQDVKWLSSLTSIYIVGAVVWILWVFIENLLTAFTRRDNLKIYAVKGFFQTFKLIILAIGIIIAISIMIHRSPLVILTALGASAAILILIFQDTILGLVASIQFMANNLLHHGDWIEDKVHEVNGEVEEITLSAVKVRNWDNSISVVSPYLLLKNSFRNYQPMRRSGCRRISRAVYIDMNSVGFCTAEELEQLKADGFITAEEARGKMINLTLVRRYLTRWLNNHEHVSHDSLTMVRQLKPTNSGLPLELYFFVNDTNWQRYEEIQCDIFDYVYAVIRRFGLSIFQTPAGTDLARAADKE